MPNYDRQCRVNPAGYLARYCRISRNIRNYPAEYPASGKRNQIQSNPILSSLVLPNTQGVADLDWAGEELFLSELGRGGRILDHAYSLPVCSPSRAAFLTGVYPFKLGLQVSPLISIG